MILNNSETLAIPSRMCMGNKFVVGVLALVALAGTACAQQNRWTDVSRVVAMSDPHGAYDAFVATLANAGIIDADGQWSGGDAHLVITGDLVDRGADSRKVMDLVMALETQAADFGGMVHLTLGNHEVMNLVGDLRYVAAGEYAAFAAEESTDERERWFEKFREGRVTADTVLLREEFNRDRPPGFFAHRRAFSSKGKYGRWLLRKPVMVVVNNTAFVHGGLSPLVADYNLDELNTFLTSQVADYVAQLDVLVEAELIDPALNFYDHLDAVSELLADKSLSLSTGVHNALQTVENLGAASIHGRESPLWYRGTVGCSTVIEADTLGAALAAIGADRVVIGHTPTYTRRVLQRHNGRVVEVDTGMLNAAYRGSGYALIIDRDGLSVIGEKTELPGAPIQHPRRVGMRPSGMTFTDLEQVLMRGEIESRSAGVGGRNVLKLRMGEQEIDALFIENPRNREQSPALAAYRLDRLLGLDMVPLTVAREINGKRGAMQFKPPQTHNERDRVKSGQGGDAWCSLRQQWNAMYIFDSLIYNEGRPQEDMLYSPDNWQLVLSGNVNTFDNKRSKPRYLMEAPLQFGPSWTAALESLTDERLTAELGGVLDRRRLTALRKRRDILLKEAAAAGSND